MNSATAQAIREVSGRMQEAYEIVQETAKREGGDEFLVELQRLLGHIDRHIYRSLAMMQVNGELPDGIDLQKIQVFPGEVEVDLSGPIVNAEWRERRSIKGHETDSGTVG